jgi:hypothetical protein
MAAPTAAAAKKTLAGGKDPSAERKQGKLQLRTTFEIIAREWHEKQALAWSAIYYKRTMDNLMKNAFPYVGNRPIADITAPGLLTMLRRLVSRGTIATAHAIRGSVLPYSAMPLPPDARNGILSPTYTALSLLM